MFVAINAEVYFNFVSTNRLVFASERISFEVWVRVDENLSKCVFFEFVICIVC